MLFFAILTRCPRFITTTVRFLDRNGHFSSYREKAREEKEGERRLWERCVNRLRFSTVSIAAAMARRFSHLGRSSKAVYLPTNHFLREEVMDTQKYLSYFFPFEKPDFFKNGKDSLWNINGDRTMIALAMTFRKEPEAQVMCFMRGYAERYDWLEQTFQDWSFTFLSSFLFYEEDEEMDEDTRDIYRQGMAAFGGIAPNYHIELWERPTIVWDFHSLLLAIQMMFSFMLADETSSLRLCRHCMKAFFAKSDDEDFCSPACEASYEKENEK